MDLSVFIRSLDCQSYNRNVARELKSVNAAIFLSELVFRYLHIRDLNKLLIDDDKEWFYYTRDMAQERLILSRTEQDSAIRKLIEFDFIEKSQKSMPSKRYFHLNILKINEFELSDDRTHNIERNKEK